MIPIHRALTSAGAALMAVGSLAACAHVGDKPMMTAALPTEQPLDARARLYPDCASAAVKADTVSRFGHYLRFRCAGAPAKAMFDQLEIFSRSRGYETVSEGLVIRRTNDVSWDDQCRRSGEGTAATYACYFNLPVTSDFLDGIDVKPAKKR